MTRQYSYDGAQARSYGGNGYKRQASASYAQPQPKKKHSGAKFKKMEDGSVVVSGWRLNKERQMISLYARPYKKTKVTESKNGTKWANLFVTITNQSTLQQTNCSGLLDVNGKRLYIKEYNLIATQGGRGGYFGRHLGGQR